MSYMWENFNIKTFPAETVVFCDGVFQKDLSTIKNTDINEKYDLPIHIIYVGNIYDENNLNVNINVENQKVFLTAKIKNEKPAFFNIFIKNAGKNSEFRGHILLENNNELNCNFIAQHDAANTTILIKTKLLAGKDSKSKLSGTAIINKNCDNINSDVSFSALADKNARIEFMPAQRISAVPNTADHSAAMFKPTDAQIEYLRQAGLSGQESIEAMKEAFINDMNLF